VTRPFHRQSILRAEDFRETSQSDSEDFTVQVTGYGLLNAACLALVIVSGIVIFLCRGL
jgi:hypothetical protein